jgi:hypothetical protein
MTDPDVTVLRGDLQQVNESLVALATTVARFDAKQADLVEKVHNHERVLHGLPENGQKVGLTGRVDRIEQRLRMAWAVVLGVGALLADMIRGWF